MFGAHSSVRGAVAATSSTSNKAQILKFDPSKSSFECSSDLRSYTPYSPFKHHANGYISLVEAIQQSLNYGRLTHKFDITSKPGDDPVTFTFEDTKYEVDKDLIPEDCISSGTPRTILFFVKSDHCKKVTELTLNTTTDKNYYTLQLKRNVCAYDTTINLIEYNKQKKIGNRLYYNGELRNGKMTDDTGLATCTLYNADGSKAEYKGKFIDGERTDDTGSATYTWYNADGSKKEEYKGKLIDGEITDDTGCATFTLYNADGSKKAEYKGKFIDGRMTDDTGSATFTWYNADGSKAEYKSKFIDDKMTDDTGRATCTWYNANGSKKEEYKGKFIDDRRTDDTGSATFTFYNANGSKKSEYKGKFIDGERTDDTGSATYTSYNANGSKKEEYKGKFINGERVDDTGRATYTWYNADGSKAEYKVIFINGKMESLIYDRITYEQFKLFINKLSKNPGLIGRNLQNSICAAIIAFKDHICEPDVDLFFNLINFTDSNLQRQLLLELSGKIREYAARKMLIIDHDKVFPECTTKPENLFGMFIHNLIADDSDLIIYDCNVSDCLDNTNFVGSYGVIKGNDGTLYLLVYDSDSGASQTSTNASRMSLANSPEAKAQIFKEEAEKFLGVFNATPDTSHLYISSFKNLRLFKIDKKTPDPADLTQVSTDFKNYPTALKVLIARYVPNINDFTSSNIIKFVFDFIDAATATEEDKHFLKECILRIFEGNGFYPGTLGLELSKKFNDMLPLQIPDVQVEPNYVNFFNEFWNRATQNDKIRLLYLFLTLASSHGLGFGHGGTEDGFQNESNKMFYALATHFLRKLKDSYGTNEVPLIVVTVLNNCDKGLCAGSSALLFENNFHLVLNNFWTKSPLYV